MPRKYELQWNWNNWTFGIWLDTKRSLTWGIDFGPIEFMYKPASWRERKLTAARNKQIEKSNTNA